MKAKSKRQRVIDLVHGLSVIRPRDLKEHDLSKDYLYILAQEGVIERASRGLYQWPNKDLGRNHSLVEISKLAPKAVVALLSALNYYNMATQNPHQIWLAIDRKAWRPVRFFGFVVIPTGYDFSLKFLFHLFPGAAKRR